jgi:hypothetical protein
MLRAIALLILTLNFSSVAKAQIQQTQASWVTYHVLFERDGHPAYGTVRARGPLNEARNSRGQVSISHDRMVQGRLGGWSRSSGGVTVNFDQITSAVPFLSKNLQGVERRLQAGSVVLREDNRAYHVLQVFSDGRVVAELLSVNRVSRHRLPGTNLTRSTQDPAHHIFHSNEIRAVAVNEFRATREQSYQVNGRYQNIAGMPLCDVAALRRYQLPTELRGSSDLRFSCGRDSRGAQIDALFSNGTVMIGQYTFNPFPRSLEAYTAPGERETESRP